MKPNPPTLTLQIPTPDPYVPLRGCDPLSVVRFRDDEVLYLVISHRESAVDLIHLRNGEVFTKSPHHPVELLCRLSVASAPGSGPPQISVGNV